MAAAWLPEESMCSTGDRRSNEIEHSFMSVIFVRIYLWVGSEESAGIQCTQMDAIFVFMGLRVSRESIWIHLREHYISGPVENCGI